MYETVHRIVLANENAWNSLPAFQASFTRFETVLEGLKQSAELHNQIIKGVTRFKDKQKKGIIEDAIRFFGLLQAYAEIEQNVKLETKVNWKPSLLNKLPDRDRLSTLKNLVDLCNLYAAELAPFGLDPQELADFTAKLEAYEEVLVAPREAIINRHLVTEAIAAQVKTIDTILKKELDPFMLALKTVAPDFVDLYTAARIIVDKGIRHNDPSQKGAEPPERDDGEKQ